MKTDNQRSEEIKTLIETDAEKNMLRLFGKSEAMVNVAAILGGYSKEIDAFIKADPEKNYQEGLNKMEALMVILDRIGTEADTVRRENERTKEFLSEKIQKEENC